MKQFPNLEISSKLGEFFPASDPDSVWLFRLMVLRDDINHEFYNLALKPEDDSSAVWRSSYYVRRLSNSLVEVRGIFEQNVGKLLKKSSSPYLNEFKPFLENAISLMKSAMKDLKPFRNNVGGHFRPKDIKRVIAAMPDVQGRAIIASNNLRESCYHSLSSTSIWFAKSDTNKFEDIHEFQIKIRDILLKLAPEAMAAVDALLMWFWVKNKVYKTPEGMELAVINKETGKMKRLPSAT